jgi:hypothetical protein
VVGELAELEAVEALAAEDDAGQRRRERLDRLDAAGEEWAIAGASPVWGSRSDDASFVR